MTIQKLNKDYMKVFLMQAIILLMIPFDMMASRQSSMSGAVRGPRHQSEEVAKVIYLWVSEDKETVIFKYGDPTTETEGFYQDLSTNSFHGGYLSEADNYHILYASVDKSMKDARPKETIGWFENFVLVTQIPGLQYLNTSECESMANMFKNCESLESCDVSHFNTSKVEDFGCMFMGCECLEEIDVSNFDTQNATNFNWMFSGCKEVTKLNVAHFNTSNVKELYDTFYGCESIKELDLSGWDTSNNTDLHSTFGYMLNLRSIKFGPKFSTANVWLFNGTFSMDKSLQVLDLSTWTIQGAMELIGMFYKCEQLTTIVIDPKVWKLPKEDQLRGSNDMFSECYVLTGEKGTIAEKTKDPKWKYARIDKGTSGKGIMTSMETYKNSVIATATAEVTTKDAVTKKTVKSFWGTLYSDDDIVVPGGVRVYIIKKVDKDFFDQTGTAILTELPVKENDVLCGGRFVSSKDETSWFKDAGYGYLIRSANKQSFYFKKAEQQYTEEESKAKSADLEGNMLHGSDTEKFTGQKWLYNFYMLGRKLKDSGWINTYTYGFMKYAEDGHSITNQPHKAFIVESYPDEAIEAKPITMFLLNDNETSGIREVENKKQQSDAIYNISGQRVDRNYRGIKIINGKKIMK